MIVDYDPLPRSSTWRHALAPGAPVQLEALGTNLAVGQPRGRRRRGAGRRRRRRARAHREPARRGGADGGRRTRRGPRRHRRTTTVPHHRVPRRRRCRTGTGATSPRMFGLDHDAGPHRRPRTSAARSAPRRRRCGALRRRAALRLGRPVKWIETRSENLVAMPHGRGQVQYVELGFDARRYDHRAALPHGRRRRRVRRLRGPLASATDAHDGQGVYRVPKIVVRGRGGLTNTTPMGAFRGAGRPEAAAMLERVMDIAAVELGIDPVELRRRNFLPPDEFPFTTLTGAVYDSGDYDLSLARPCASPGYDGSARGPGRAGGSAVTECSSASASPRTSRSPRRRRRSGVGVGRGARRRRARRSRRHVVARSGTCHRRSR